MSARVDRINSIGTSILNMKDGDLAEVVECWDHTLPVGSIIQRYGNTIVPIGEPSRMAYSTLLKTPCDGYTCRILGRGDTIRLT